MKPPSRGPVLKDQLPVVLKLLAVLVFAVCLFASSQLWVEGELLGVRFWSGLPLLLQVGALPFGVVLLYQQMLLRARVQKGVEAYGALRFFWYGSLQDHPGLLGVLPGRLVFVPLMPGRYAQLSPQDVHSWRLDSVRGIECLPPGRPLPWLRGTRPLRLFFYSGADVEFECYGARRAEAWFQAALFPSQQEEKVLSSQAASRRRDLSLLDLRGLPPSDCATTLPGGVPSRGWLEPSERQHGEAHPGCACGSPERAKNAGL